MKLWQIAGLVIVALLVIGGAGYLGVTLATRQQEVAASVSAPVTVPVTRGDIGQTISAPGELLWTETIDLYMDVGGVVDEVAVRAGDWVTAGDLLALLDESDVRDDLARAELDLRQASLELQELGQDADAADEAAAQAKLASAQATLSDLADPPTEQEMTAAKENLKSAQQRLNRLLSGSPDEAIIVANADMLTAEVAMQRAQSAYNKVAWSAEIGSLPESEALQSASITYERAVANYNLANSGADADLVSAVRAAVAEAQERLNLLVDGPDPDAVKAAQALVEQAQAELAELLDGASASDLEQAELNVARALLAVNNGRYEVAATALMAPADGVVLEVLVTRGQRVDKGDGGVRLADPAALELYATVIEEDYTITKVGQALNVFFDAMPEETVSGRIDRIVPEKIQGERPLYAIFVDLDNLPKGLAEGMTADAEIIIDERTDVLRLPRSLVKARTDGSAMVDIWTGERKVSRAIQTGLRGDAYIEIVDGLSEGDKVVGR
jgi:RND family efflux transporter MFP subunit